MPITPQATWTSRTKPNPAQPLHNTGGVEIPATSQVVCVDEHDAPVHPEVDGGWVRVTGGVGWAGKTRDSWNMPLGDRHPL